MNNDFGSFPSHKRKLAYNKKQWFCIQFPPQHECYSHYCQMALCVCVAKLSRHLELRPIWLTLVQLQQLKCIEPIFRDAFFSRAVECSSSYLEESGASGRGKHWDFTRNTNPPTNSTHLNFLPRHWKWSANFGLVGRKSWSSGIGVSWKGRE